MDHSKYQEGESLGKDTVVTKGNHTCIQQGKEGITGNEEDGGLIEM